MYSMGNFTLEIALDTLYYGLLELMSAREELFIHDFQNIINEMLILDDEIESFIKNKVIKSKPIRYSPRSPYQSIPDYNEVSIQIEGARVDIGVQSWMIEHPGFSKKLDDFDLKLGKLADRVSLAATFVNFSEQNDISLKGVKKYFPEFSSLVDRLSVITKSRSDSFQYDPLEKILPSPKGGGYRKSRIFHETINTGSKAPLMFQGRGRSADLSKLPSRRKRTF